MRIRVLIGTARAARLDMIDYSDSINRVMESSWEFSQTYGPTIDVLSFDLDDVDNSISIEQGYDVLIENYDSPSDILFGGIVASIRMSEFGAGRILHLIIQDWTILTHKATVRKTYEVVGQTDKSIIQDAFIAANGGEGVLEIDTSQVIESRTIDVLNFQGTSLAAILSMIAEITGNVWVIDYDKRLRYNPRTYGTLALDHMYSSSPDNSITFSFYNFSFEKSLADWNAVELQGGSGLSSDTTDVYAGDGSTKVFLTGEDTGTNPIHYPADGEAIITVERNTNTNASPVWTAQTVGIEGEPGIRLGINADVLWNSIHRRLQWNTAPSNFANSFRVTGRYILPVLTINYDTKAIAEHGRTFLGSLIIPEAVKIEQAHDLSMAFLRENSDHLFLKFSTNHDRPLVGRNSAIIYSKFGLSTEPIFISKVTTKILGGTVFEYDVDAEVINQDLFR